MTALALALVCCVVVVVWRVEVLLRAFVPPYVERTFALREQSTTPMTQAEPLPPDLDAIAQRETESWAQDQVRAAIRDTYTEHGKDWNRVRTVYFGES